MGTTCGFEHLFKTCRYADLPVVKEISSYRQSLERAVDRDPVLLVSPAAACPYRGMKVAGIDVLGRQKRVQRLDYVTFDGFSKPRNIKCDDVIPSKLAVVSREERIVKVGCRKQREIAF